MFCLFYQGESVEPEQLHACAGFCMLYVSCFWLTHPLKGLLVLFKILPLVSGGSPDSSVSNLSFHLPQVRSEER